MFSDEVLCRMMEDAYDSLYSVWHIYTHDLDGNNQLEVETYYHHINHAASLVLECRLECWKRHEKFIHMQKALESFWGKMRMLRMPLVWDDYVINRHMKNLLKEIKELKSFCEKECKDCYNVMDT